MHITTPITPIVPWLGGKRNLAKRICAIINATPCIKAMFERTDFARMADQLASIRGRFIFSLNDVPEVRDIFSGFQQRQVVTSYSVGGKKESPRGELLISNSLLTCQENAL